MSKSNVYTRTGDKGTTSLVGGERITKNDVRLDAYGTIDELSSWIGTVAASDACPAEIIPFLHRIQNRLFDLGAYLATAPREGFQPQLPSINQDEIEAMEHEIDRMDGKIPPLHAFILPGGTQTAAFAHVARTVCRRAERRMLDLNAAAPLFPSALEYINRLSDYLFVAAKYINAEAGVPETTWEQYNA